MRGGLNLWKGRKVLITAGPTHEYMDPVRFLTNASSGTMGFALARAAHSLGAKVVVVLGPTRKRAPPNVKIRPVKTAREMLREVLKRSARTDVFIATAAVADWRFAQPSPHKIKKTGEPLKLTLLPNPDILASVGRLRRRPLLVGFALETRRWLSYAREKLAAKNLDLIVANRASALGSDRAQLAVLWKDGRIRRFPVLAKAAAARRLLRCIASELETLCRQN